MTIFQPEHASAQPSPANDVDFVLKERVPESMLQGTSRFKDSSWNLHPAQRMGHARRISLHFDTVPLRHRHSCKEVFAALLDGKISNAGRPYSVETLRGTFTEILAFLTFLDGKKITRIRDVTQRDLVSYVAYLANTGRLRLEYLNAARLFWVHRSILTDALDLDPQAVDIWEAPKVERPRENLTDRMPEEIFAPLLWWSARFIENFADDILLARERFLPLYGARKSAPAVIQRQRRGNQVQWVEKLLDEYEASGEALPSLLTGLHAGQVNLSAIDRRAQVPIGTTSRSFRLRARALAETNGLQGGHLMLKAEEITGEVFGKPWVTQIDYSEITLLSKLLQTAAWVLIAFFSGMRDSEVKHVRRGCINVASDSTGRLEELHLTSVAFKGNSEKNGKVESWVVAPIVKTAVDVLERLVGPDSEYLFRPLVEGTVTGKSRNITELVKSHETNEWLGYLIEWINKRSAALGVLQGIPEFRGQTWKPKTKQFRRTLAWFIARRPEGIAAGALQYKHLSLDMFRGYAGTSPSGFRAEVEAENALARGDFLTDFVARAEEAAGPSRDRVRDKLATLGRALGFAGRKPENRQQELRFLRRHAPDVFRGDALVCVFDPAKALCLRNKSKNHNFKHCEPLRCGNAVFLPEDIDEWRERAVALQELAADPAFAPFPRARALEMSKKIVAYFDRLQEGNDD